MDKAPTPLTDDFYAMHWPALLREEPENMYVKHARDLERRLSALQADARDGAYYKWRLEKILPLFEEARDALPAISLAAAKLRGLDLTLGDRMDEAGRPQRAEWDAATQSTKEKP